MGHEQEIGDFRRRFYPWELLQPNHLVPFSDLLDANLMPVLENVGFDTANRKTTARTWQCSTRLHGEVLDVLCEVTPKGSSVDMYLLVRSLQFRQSLGYPFALSGASMTAVNRPLLARGLESFAGAFEAIAPAVVAACSEGIRAGLEILDVDGQ